MLPNRLLLSASALFALGLGGFLWTRFHEAERGRQVRERAGSRVGAQEDAAPNDPAPAFIPLEVRGSTTADADNRPLRDVVVSLTRIDQVAPWAGVQSQGDGGFRIFATPGRYAVTGFLPGYLPRVTASVTTPAITTTELTLPLSAGGVAVGGSVVDETGRPIEGVWVHAFDSAEIKAVPVPLAVSKTDGRGRYRLSLSPGPVTLRVERDGFESRLSTYHVTTATALPPLALARSGAVEGVVSTPDSDPPGEPITVAWSALSWQGTPDGGLMLAPSGSGEVAAAPDGAFVISTISSGAHVMLDAFTREHATTSAGWLRLGRAEARVSVPLTTSQHPVVRGQILDAATGAAVHQAEVTLVSGDTRRRAVTPLDGSFVLPTLGEVGAKLRVRVHGYVPVTRDLDDISDEQLVIELIPSEPRPLRLGSEDRGMISVYGTTDDAGTPSRQLYVSDGDGVVSITLEGLTTATIEAMDRQGRYGGLRVPDVAQWALPSSIEVSPTAPLSGVLRDRAGQPIPNATVVITRAMDDATSPPSDPSAPPRGVLQPRATYTDPRGIFRLTKLLPGRYALAARDARGFRIPVSTQTLEVREGDSASPPRQIQSSYKLRAVNGTVTDLRKLPVANASITVVPQRAPTSHDPAFAVDPVGHASPHVRANAAGAFSVQIPEGARFSIIAEGPQHQQGALLRAPREPTSIAVRLQPYGLLEAETDPTRPIGSCEEFELKAPFVTMTFPLRGRVTQIERLVPGIYDLDFRCGSATTTQTITIEAGQNLRIRQAASSDE